MCGDKDKFIELDEAISGNFTFADHSKVALKGKGMILIKLKDGSHWFIGDVYYIPTVKSNILSLGQLLAKGYEIKMKDHTLTLIDIKGHMIAKVVMTKNRMFLLNIETDMPKCLNTYVKDETWLCHMRLGHVNFDSLKMMAQKEMLKGLPSIIHPNQLCEGCLVGKQFHKSFSNESTSRANQPLQEIHVNVYGPIKPCSFGKNSYFLLFIDDYSRKTWVYFLKEKSNVFSCFKKFKALVEKKLLFYKITWDE